MGIMGTNGNGWEEMGLTPFKEGVLGQLFDFLDELALLEVLGDDASVVVDDVVVDGGEPELLEGGGVEEGGIGDDRPVDGVALDLPVELGTVAIEVEGEDLHPAGTAALLTTNHAKGVLAVVVPRGIGGDNGNRGTEEGGLGDLAAETVGGGEVGDGTALRRLCEEGGLVLQAGEGYALRLLGSNGLAELLCLRIVGSRRLQEVAGEDVDGGLRLGMLADERFCLAHLLRRRDAGDVVSERRHEFVGGGATDDEVLQRGDIALYLHGLAGLCEEWQLGEVREDENKGAGVFAGGGIDEVAFVDVDGIDLRDDAVWTIHIELALVEVLKRTLHTEVVATATTGTDGTHHHSPNGNGEKYAEKLTNWFKHKGREI